MGHQQFQAAPSGTDTHSEHVRDGGCWKDARWGKEEQKPPALRIHRDWGGTWQLRLRGLACCFPHLYTSLRAPSRDLMVIASSWGLQLPALCCCLCVTLGTASPPSDPYWAVLTFPHRTSLWDPGLMLPRPLPQLCAFACLPVVRMMGAGGGWGVTPCQKTKAKALVPDAKGTTQKRATAGTTTRFLRKAPGCSGTFQELQYRMLVSHLEDCTYTDRPTSHAHQVRSFL